MERAQRKHAYYPVKCPGCSDIVHLLIRNSLAVTVHIHKAEGCNKIFYYRCWIEQGLPLPRVEFFSTPNAMQVPLQPHADPTSDDGAPPVAPPSPHPQTDTRLPHRPVMRRRRGSAKRPSR